VLPTLTVYFQKQNLKPELRRPLVVYSLKQKTKAKCCGYKITSKTGNNKVVDNMAVNIKVAYATVILSQI
jgi:hypothetical protein